MAKQPKSEPQASAPYEGELKIALNKLTSEVLLFLLAYTILLIGLGVFGSGLATELRTLLYIIPILGVGAYVWLQRRTNAKKPAAKPNVKVGVGIAQGGASVIGERGGSGQEQGNTDVRAGIASGSNVIGRDYGRVGSQSASDTDAADVRYLVEIFQGLGKADRDELMANALRIRQKEGQSHA